jgi:uncharacterized membrane protein
MIVTSRRGRVHVGLFTWLMLAPVYFIAGMIQFYVVVIGWAFEASVAAYRIIVPAVVRAIKTVKESRNG